MMGLGNVGGLGRLGYAAANSVGWWLSEAQLDLDFANDRSFNRKTGYQASPNGLLTYTSPSPKMVYGADGVLGYARHNLLPNSIWGGAYSGDDWTPTSWVYGAVTGTGTAQPSAASATDTAIRFATSGGAQREFLTVTLSAVAGDRFRFSFDLETVTNAISWNQLFTVPSLGAVVETYNGETTVASATPIGVGSRIYVDFNVATSGTLAMRFGVGCSSNTNGDIVVSRPMLQKLPFVGQEYLRNTSTSAAKYDLPIDHDPLTGEALGVLIEEQRTNLTASSQDFIAWIRTDVTVTTDVATAPDGTTTAARINVTAGSAIHYVYSPTAILFTSGTTYTFSAFVKKTNHDYVQITGGSPVFGTGQWATFNLASGTVENSTGGTAAIQALDDDWYRCSWTVAATTTTTNGSPVIVVTNGSNARLPTWTAAGTETVLIWGGQAEAGAFATSYIQTGSAQVTRAADQVSLATSAFNFSASAGTLVVEATPVQVSASCYVAALDDGTGNELTAIRIISDRWRLLVLDNTVQQANIDIGSAQVGAEVAAAIAYAADDFAGARNGSVALTDTGGTVPTPTSLKVGYIYAGGQFNGHIKRLTYWNTRKPNAELQVLSA